MRVLITVPRIEIPGGVSNYYRVLRPHLDQDKIYFEIGSIPGHSGPLRRVLRLAEDYVRFHRTLKHKQIDLVHLNPSLNSYAVCRDGLFLLIALAHGKNVLVFFRGWRPSVEAIIRRRFRRLFQAIYGRARATVVLAGEFQKTLVSLGIPGPFFIETTVVEDEVFSSPSGVSAHTTQREGFRVLFLSRLVAGKGLPEALDAFALLQTTVPGATLDIAGDGPLREWAEREVDRRGLRGVQFLGHISGSEKRSAFEQSDTYLFMSLAEGMPNSVLEAMAHGLPVVTRPVGGLRDFFVDGVMGYAVDSTDAADFARRLAQLAADPALRACMGRHNRHYARNRFTASVVASRLLAIYDTLRPAVAGGCTTDTDVQ